MSHIGFRCTNCNLLHQENILTLECLECKYPLDIEYPNNLIAHNSPIHNSTNGFSLSEGNTPTVQLHSLDSMLGLKFRGFIEKNVKYALLKKLGSFVWRKKSPCGNTARSTQLLFFH